MHAIGLTGGIGSGKSTVSALLAAKGAVIIDADAITREVQQPGTEVFLAMVERFGPGIVAADGTLDRQAVADIVFNDPDALKALNDIVHPAVGAETTRRLLEQADTDNLVVLDIPLLVESAGKRPVAGVIVVDVDPEVAVQRLVGSPRDAGGRRPGPDVPPGDPGGAPRPGGPRDRQLGHPGGAGGPDHGPLARDRGARDGRRSLTPVVRVTR